MPDVTELLESRYWGNTTSQWLLAAAVFLGVTILLLLARRIVRSQYSKMAATEKVELLELPFMIASRTTLLFILIAALYGASQFLVLPTQLARLLLTLFTIVAFWQAGVWTTTTVLAALERKRRVALTSDRAVAGTLGIIGFLARVTIWSLVLLLTLDNLGVEIKPLLAGLGIGGIAVALAVQNVLGDLFASLSITLDRPFVVGDALGVDGFNGTVEYIGVKSTRLRSVDGEQIIMPNANLLNSRLRNYSRMTKRRVTFTLSLSLQTPRATLAKIPALIREIVESYPDTRFERSHFAKITPRSFDIETVYFMTTPNYDRYMDVLQEVQLRALEVLEKEGVSLA
jgi:small-conductance mechanosensitive channel